jgi:hypothetical protein
VLMAQGAMRWGLLHCACNSGASVPQPLSDLGACAHCEGKGYPCAVVNYLNLPSVSSFGFYPGERKVQSVSSILDPPPVLSAPMGRKNMWVLKTHSLFPQRGKFQSVGILIIVLATQFYFT